MIEAVIEPRRIFGGRYKPLGPARAKAMKRLPEFEIRLDGVAAGKLSAEQYLPLSL